MVTARFFIVFSALLLAFLGIWAVLGILGDRPYVKKVLLLMVGLYALVCATSVLFSLAGI
jgi:Ca2+/Na+ antiporter